jgi:ethanolamine kinase
MVDGVQYRDNADAVLSFNVRDGEHREADVKQVAQELTPKGYLNGELVVDQVSGGITNELYKVTGNDASHSVLVRLYGANTEILIDREMDNKCCAELSRLQLAPTFFGRFTNGRVEGYVQARALEPAEMSQRSPIDIVALIGEEIGKLHTLEDVHIDGARDSQLWKRLNEWLQLAKEINFEDDADKQSALKALDLAAVESKLKWVQAQLEHHSSSSNGSSSSSSADDASWSAAVQLMRRTVFAHNDLLSGNILLQEQPEPKIWLIDFEYTGWSTCAFDIANHWCEHAGFDCKYAESYPSADTQRVFLQHYATVAAPDFFSREEPAQVQQLLDAMRHTVNQYALVSHLYWSIWAVIQAKHSPVEFDYLGYSARRQQGFAKHKQEFFDCSS